MNASQRRAAILRLAWTGDAVLSLYVRQRILAEGKGIDNEKAARMTSNQFLSHFGEASEIESKIGVLYEAEGLPVAFQWIEEHLVPAFERIEAKRFPKPRQDGRIPK